MLNNSRVIKDIKQYTMSTWHEKFANRKQDQLDAERKKKVEVNDISFPTLGAAGSAWEMTDTPVVAEKPKLSSLLVEWDARTKEEEQRKADKAAAAVEKQSYNYIYSRSNYHGIGNTHSREEDTYYEDEFEDNELPPIPTADTSTDWRIIERPVRKPKKTGIEKMMEPELHEFPLEESSVWQTEGVWERER